MNLTVIILVGLALLSLVRALSSHLTMRRARYQNRREAAELNRDRSLVAAAMIAVLALVTFLIHLGVTS